MGSQFTFYDYVDGQGENVVYSWMSGIPKTAKGKFDARIRYLEATPPGQWGTGSRLVDTLTDEGCEDLFEIRVRYRRVQYRILGTHSGRRPILLHCFVKPDSRVRIEECNRAKRKLDLATADPTRHRVEHVYEQE